MIRLDIWLRAGLTVGTVGTRVTAIRLPGGAARVRLACPARPLRPGQRCRDPDSASSGRRPPASGQGAEAVVGRPGSLGRVGPAAAPRPAPPAAADHLPADPAALARRPRSTALGLSAPFCRAAQDRGSVRALVLEMARDNTSWGTGASTASWPAWATSSRRFPAAHLPAIFTLRNTNPASLAARTSLLVWTGIQSHRRDGYARASWACW
jgi:hypothetical protein